MSETFLNLPTKEQAEILNTLSTRIGKSALILEKDIWLCWALEMLFKMPNRLSMAFKGGTSLSKVFCAIQRFSEDVDITIDCHALNCGNPFDDNISKTQLKKVSAQIQANLIQYIQNHILPYYEKVTDIFFKKEKPKFVLDDDGETLYLHYPSTINQKIQYISDSIRLEFGGRNLTTPNNSHIIKPDIAEYINTLKFPTAHVSTLSPQKTFWEKVTLIHYECNRPMLRNDANRISRHWYDIAMLTKHDIGIQALKNRNLLQDTIKIKKIFYDASYAKYDDCLTGKLRLIPKDNHLKLLKEDFKKMLDEKMYFGEQPDFDEIMEQTNRLEEKINEAYYQ